MQCCCGVLVSLPWTPSCSSLTLQQSLTRYRLRRNLRILGPRSAPLGMSLWPRNGSLERLSRGLRSHQHVRLLFPSLPGAECLHALRVCHRVTGYNFTGNLIAWPSFNATVFPNFTRAPNGTIVDLVWANEGPSRLLKPLRGIDHSH